MPVFAPLAIRTFCLAALILATWPWPADAAQAPQPGCTALPVIGRSGDVLYWTGRRGCAEPLVAAASDDGPIGRDTPAASPSGTGIAEIPTPVSGISAHAPVMR